MNSIVRILIFLILFGLAFLGILLPLKALMILCGILIVEFIWLKNKIGKNKIIVVGKTSSIRWPNIIMMIFGGLFMILGYFNKDDNFAYLGINSGVYLGLASFIQGLTYYDNYSILLKNSSLKINEFDLNNELKYSRISSLLVKSNRLEIDYKNDKKIIWLLDTDNKSSLTNFLKPKLGDRLIIEE